MCRVRACLNRVALPNRMGAYPALTGDGMHGECTHPLMIHGRRDTRRIGGLGVELAQNIVNLIKEGRDNEGVELVHWLAEAAHFAVEVV